MFRRTQLTLHQNGRRQILGDGVRTCSDLPRRHLCVLRGDRRIDVVRVDVEADHLVGIDPDTQRALGGKKLRAPDTIDASDFTDDAAIDVIAEFYLVATAVGRCH